MAVETKFPHLIDYGFNVGGTRSPITYALQSSPATVKSLMKGTGELATVVSAFLGTILIGSGEQYLRTINGTPLSAVHGYLVPYPGRIVYCTNTEHGGSLTGAEDVKIYVDGSLKQTLADAFQSFIKSTQDIAVSSGQVISVSVATSGGTIQVVDPIVTLGFVPENTDV